jgi:hypothetical protein
MGSARGMRFNGVNRANGGAIRARGQETWRDPAPWGAEARGGHVAFGRGARPRIRRV